VFREITMANVGSDRRPVGRTRARARSWILAQRGAPRSWCASRGGHNAGHTLVIGNQTYKLALLPSGVVRKGKLSIIGNGVVVDPWHFLEEVKR